MTEPCDIHCPFIGCASCAYAGGEIPTVATESARIGVAKTNGPGLESETVLATPIQASEREDYRTW